MNGAEVLYMPSYPEPWVGMDWYEIHNRSRALDNTCYVIAPNSGAWYLNEESKVPIYARACQAHQELQSHPGSLLGS